MDRELTGFSVLVTILTHGASGGKVCTLLCTGTCADTRYQRSFSSASYISPQGFVLGAILFILYIQPLTSVILEHPVSHMLCADDTQVYESFDLVDCLSSFLCVEMFVSDVKTWMMSNKFHMNEDKTEVLLLSTKRVANMQHLPELIKY